jgi:hypothetical protein
MKKRVALRHPRALCARSSSLMSTIARIRHPSYSLHATHRLRARLSVGAAVADKWCLSLIPMITPISTFTQLQLATWELARAELISVERS